MSIGEMKIKLHSYIELISDENQLELLNEVAQAYLSQQPDIIDSLSPEQLVRLEEAVRQADNEQLSSHEEVVEKSKEWYLK